MKVPIMKRSSFVIFILTAGSCLQPGQVKNKTREQKGIELVRQWVSQLQGAQGGESPTLSMTLSCEFFPRNRFSC